jgi:hypothetical protein
LHRRLHSWQDFDRCKRYRIKTGDVNAGFLWGPGWLAASSWIT